MHAMPDAFSTVTHSSRRASIAMLSGWFSETWNPETLREHSVLACYLPYFFGFLLLADRLWLTDILGLTVEKLGVQDVKISICNSRKAARGALTAADPDASSEEDSPGMDGQRFQQ